MRPRRPSSHDERAPAGAEEVLRALAGQELDGNLPAPDDEQLRAYREGRLPERDVRELEALLARSPAGRRRLLELAGIDRSLPLRRVRRAVLAAAGQRRTAPWAAAAAVAAGAVLALLTLLPRHPGLPPGLTYEVAARGLADVRSAGEGGSAVRAYPETTVRIAVRPRGEAPAGVSIGLFRREAGALRRVPPREARPISERGSAAFEGAAADLLAARAPGAYSLYVVVSAEKELPSRVKVAPGEDPAAALRSSGRLVYPLAVTLLPQEPPPEEGNP